MEERLEVARAFFMQTTETVIAIKQEVEEIKRTWESGEADGRNRGMKEDGGKFK